MEHYSLNNNNYNTEAKYNKFNKAYNSIIANLDLDKDQLYKINSEREDFYNKLINYININNSENSENDNYSKLLESLFVYNIKIYDSLKAEIMDDMNSLINNVDKEIAFIKSLYSDNQLEMRLEEVLEDSAVTRKKIYNDKDNYFCDMINNNSVSGNECLRKISLPQIEAYSEIKNKEIRKEHKLYSDNKFLSSSKSVESLHNSKSNCNSNKIKSIFAQTQPLLSHKNANYDNKINYSQKMNVKFNSQFASKYHSPSPLHNRFKAKTQKGSFYMISPTSRFK